jgi:hypothetical protein
MMFRKLPSPGRLQPAANDNNSRFCDGPAVDGAQRARSVDWRDAARALARRLMPVMVLVAAAVLGLAAVAIA